jgi:hypothetical protein
MKARTFIGLCLSALCSSFCCSVDGMVTVGREEPYFLRLPFL